MAKEKIDIHDNYIPGICDSIRSLQTVSPLVFEGPRHREIVLSLLDPIWKKLKNRYVQQDKLHKLQLEIHECQVIYLAVASGDLPEDISRAITFQLGPKLAKA